MYTTTLKSKWIAATHKSIPALLLCCSMSDGRAEDLTLPDLPAREQVGADGVLRAVATQLQQSAKREAAQRAQRNNPSAFVDAQTAQLISQNNSMMPSMAVPLGNASVSLSKDTLAVSTPDSRLRLGAGSANNGVASRLEYAKLLNERYALGLGVQLGKHQSEFLTRNIYLTEDKKLEFDVALSYMKARPKFDFDSGAERLSVTQFSGVASVRRLFAPEDGIGLHSLGASIWGSQARSPNNLSEMIVINDTPTYVSILSDPRRISLGRMRGQSLDAQYATSAAAVFNASVGAEQVIYPMADGTRESQLRPYLAAGLKYEMENKTMLDLRLASGVSNSATLSVSGAATRLALSVARGRNGAPNNTSLMLYVDLLKLLDPARKNQDAPSLALKESLQRYSDAGLLDKAATRPMQLPQNVLAKVDHTGVRKVTVEKAGLPPGSKYNADYKHLLIAVGTGALTLVNFQRNGVVQALMPQFVLSSGAVTVDVHNLPASTSPDKYEIRVMDASGSVYSVKLSSSAD